MTRRRNFSQGTRMRHCSIAPHLRFLYHKEEWKLPVHAQAGSGNPTAQLRSRKEIRNETAILDHPGGHDCHRCPSSELFGKGEQLAEKCDSRLKPRGKIPAVLQDPRHYGVCLHRPRPDRRGGLRGGSVPGEIPGPVSIGRVRGPNHSAGHPALSGIYEKHVTPGGTRTDPKTGSIGGAAPPRSIH